MSRVRIEHVALWVRDLEAMRSFYETQLGGRAGALYSNERTGYRSYFLSFGEGARLELMTRDGLGDEGGGARPSAPAPGWAHVALAVGSRDEVDARVEALAAAGVTIQGAPRTTGDGYYEAVVIDPEGNSVELIAG